MSSVLMAADDFQYHYEIDPNYKKVVFDEAMDELKDLCERVDFSEVTSIKFHTNSWGLSCSGFFGTQYMTQMKSL
jgi:hypothetical protein